MTARYSPVDPMFLGSTGAAPGVPPSPVLSAMVGNNADLMQAVGSLWITPDDVVADVTYGKGVFWRNLKEPTYAFDLMTGQDCRALPLPDASVDVVVIDPPYRPTHGSKGFGAKMAHDYQLGGTDLDSITDVLALYEEAIIEAHRVLRPNGRIMVKTQDLTYNHRLHLVSIDVLRAMLRNRFALVDQFVLLNKARLPSAVWKRQERSRRAHSILWVGMVQPAPAHPPFSTG